MAIELVQLLLILLVRPLLLVQLLAQGLFVRTHLGCAMAAVVVAVAAVEWVVAMAA